MLVLASACWLCQWSPLSATAAEPQQPELDETGRSAAFLLQEATARQRDGRHNTMLRALRHLRDPELQRLFAYLADRPAPSLKIHGILGLAECTPGHPLDLLRIYSIDRPEVQAIVLGAAMDAELLSNEEAKQILGWKDLDDGVRLAAALQLVRDGQFTDMALLRRGADSNSIGRRALASIMLLEIGDDGAMSRLDKIDRSKAPLRDPARLLALQAAKKYAFAGVGQWALRVGQEKELNPRVLIAAVELALQSRTPGAEALWRQRYRQSDDAALQLRLAMVALRSAPNVRHSLFDPLRRSDDELTRRIGEAGRAIARKDRVVESVIELSKTPHPLTTGWVLDFADGQASAEQARVILQSIVLAYSHPPGEDQAPSPAQLETLSKAAQLLSERAPDHAGIVLEAVVRQDALRGDVRRQILLGLLRSNAGRAHEAVSDLTFQDAQAESMRVLLLARHGQQLAPREMDDLRVVVRGGSELSLPLRTQAAWTYLKMTDQVDLAIKQVVSQ